MHARVVLTNGTINDHAKVCILFATVGSERSGMKSASHQSTTLIIKNHTNVVNNSLSLL